KHFLTFLAIMAVVYVPVQLLSQAVTIWLLGPLTRSLNISYPVIILLSLLSRILRYPGDGALIAGVADSYLGRPVSFGSSYRQMLANIGPLLGYMGLQVLVLVGILLLAFLPFLPFAFSNVSADAAAT